VLHPIIIAGARTSRLVIAYVLPLMF
jgi:hypothetical protein